MSNRKASEEAILSVSELTGKIKCLLEQDRLLADCWVRGEISNFTRHSSGHMYFTLKDSGSRIKSVMFASKNRNLNFLPKEGMKVIIRGYVSVYERDGQYQLYVEEMQPDGLGSLFLAFQQMKERLEQEGLFSMEHKKPLPKFPKVIGVVTSPTGAAVRDIITTIRRRYPVAHILLHPVLVQGTEAPASIAAAIERLNRCVELQIDVLIVGRGGGSLEELWAFNEEIVARAIFASQIPVISAVGHETDFTIADFVADVRAATPTAAAELAVPHLLELLRHLDTTQQRLITAISNQVRDLWRRLERLEQSTVFSRPTSRIEQLRQQIDHAEDQLELLLTKLIGSRSRRVDELVRRLSQTSPVERVIRTEERFGFVLQRMLSAMSNRLTAAGTQLDRMLDKLDAYSPLHVMKRGFSLVYREEKGRHLVRSINEVQLGDRLHVRLRDGWLDCQVWGIEEEQNRDG
ncbi:exodeoxyribonuclease VII large subunit [Effusibacillus pohliae]|uniref:exodeoxyribonuclease VII large subunit n=1 Tax=Effusibacillus pohliae TaxID=232270 RepID=UPI000375B071|nr:exodeoxyribonuclease VII large subunit [Effusibacillus pohliae]